MGFPKNSAFNPPKMRTNVIPNTTVKQSASPIVDINTLERWYHVLNQQLGHDDSLPPLVREEITQVRDEVYSYLRG